jgi:ABC-type Fe3+-siderophore transport system permease subunit
MVPHMRSKKQRLAFQTCTETPAATPSILGFGISHQPHEGGDGAKCGAKFAATLCIVNLEVTGEILTVTAYHSTTAPLAF